MLIYDQVQYYRTLDGSCDIQFGFKHFYDGWRAYILTPLNYWHRPTDLHSTHRLYDSAHGLYYVCWTPPPSTLNAVKAVAAIWANTTMHYIRTGIPIDTQFQQLVGGK